MADNDLPNPFEDAAASVMHSQASQIRNNVIATQGDNPDQAANYQHLAKFTNTPLQTVYAQPDAVKQQAAMQQLDTGKLTGEYPHLAQFLTNQDNTAKSHDDLQPLAGVEGAAKALPGPSAASVPPDFEAPADPLSLSGGEAAGAFLQGLGGSFNRAEKAANLVVGAFPTLYDRAASAITGTPTTAVSDAYFKNFVEPLDQKASAFQLSPNADVLSKVMHGAGDLLGTLSQIALTGGMGEAAAPAVAATTAPAAVGEVLTHAAKSMAFPSITSAVNTGNDVYQQTGSATAAVKAATAAYATNTAMGVLPLSLSGGLGVRAATGFPLGVLTGEANRQVMNAALPANMQTPADLEGALINGITGSVLAGFMGHSPVNAALQEAHDNGLKADQSVQTMDSLQSLGQMADQSKLRERDPQAFHDFVQNISDNGHAPDIYVEASTLNDVLKQSGVTPDAFQLRMPEVAQQLQEGMQAQGYVRIPVADFATHIAGTPMLDALLPHLKTDPDGMTYQEGQAYMQEQKATLPAQAQALADQQQVSDARDQQVAAIGNDIKTQLDATGRFPETITKTYAAMHEAWYDTMSQRTGVSPEELHQQFPLKIVGHDAGELSQGDRGGYSPSDMSVHLLQDADMSTFLHESGHFYLDAMEHMASSEGAPEGIKSDMDTLLKSFGTEGTTPEERAATWSAGDIDAKRAGHEQFAEGFEKYLMDGKAPTPELQSLFGRFRSWLLNVYRNFSGLGEKMTPEVKGVMDRMLASEDAITAAEKVRGYAAADLSAEQTPEIDQYKALGQEATNDAISAMQSRSIRDMKWLSNAKSRSLKDLQNQAKAARDAIKEKVTAEVEAQPIEQARKMIKEQRVRTPEDIASEKEWKASRDATYATSRETAKQAALDNSGGVKGLEKGQYLARNKRAIDNEAERMTLDWEKQNPKPAAVRPDVKYDLLAEHFGFNSGSELAAQVKREPSAKEKIEGLTDQRMLEQHGDLVDPVSIERAAEAAIHNEARAKMMATGLKILTKSPMSATVINKAAKDAADIAIAGKKIGELRPAQYSAAESKANKALLKLAPKDTLGAAQAQRAALLNNRLFKSSSEAVADVQKGLSYLKRFNRDTVRSKIDVDVRDQIDELLARFDLRANPTDTPTRGQINLEKWIESQAAAGMQPSVSADALNPAYRTPYREMSVESFRGIVDTVRSMEHMGRERNTLTLDGVKHNLDEYINNELVPKLQERGERFTAEDLYTRPEDRGQSELGVRMDKLSSWMRGIRAQLKPQEFKRNEYDRHDLMGPFGQAVTEPVIQANYRKVDMLKGLSDDFRAEVVKLGKDWQKSLTDMVPNDKLLDAIASKAAGSPVYMKMTRGKMITMATHVGNESNFDKLTKGYGWDGAATWSFLHDNMTAKDWQSVQHIWDLYEKHWPEQAAMYKRLGQTIPDKIEARPFKTPFGEMAGGYAAIKYDPLRSRKGERDAAGEAINPSQGLFGRDYFSRATTTNGSMNARVDGYTDAIDLDFHTIERAMHDSIHDLAYREALIGANKVIEHPDFRREFMKSYGRENYKALQDWIGRIANAENGDRATGAFGRLLSYTRTGMVMNAIALRATTVLKHGGSAGIKTMGYFVGGGEKYLASRFASMGTDYRNQIQGAIEKFPEIRARLLQQDRDYRSTATSLFEAEHLRSKAERFGHSAIAWADMMTAVPTAWAAYDRAVAEGLPVKQGGTGAPMTEAQAVAYASKIVREAHGSNVESARSNIMTAPSEGVKLFTTLYGFMNNSYGQMADSANKFMTPGMGKPEVMARTFMAIIVPALWAEFLTDGLPKKADDWAHFVGKAITGEVAASVPLVRDAWSMAQGFSHAGVVGAESWMSTLVNGGKAIYKLTQGEASKGKPIQAVADALGMGLHIPGLGQLGKSAQYLTDVHTGAQPKPESTGALIKNTLVGPPKLP